MYIANVRISSLWWIVEIGSIQVVRMVYFPSTTAAMLIGNHCCMESVHKQHSALNSTADQCGIAKG